MDGQNTYSYRGASPFTTAYRSCTITFYSQKPARVQAGCAIVVLRFACCGGGAVEKTCHRRIGIRRSVYRRSMHEGTRSHPASNDPIISEGGMLQSDKPLRIAAYCFASCFWPQDMDGGRVA